MFYAHFVLSKKGPLARIWLAAHWDKKLTRSQVFETNITSSVEAILEPKVKLALRTSGHLLLGVVRIHSRQAKYLLSDCNEAFVKIKMAFRPGADLMDDTHRDTTSLAAITLSDNIHDFESTLADINDMDPFGIAVNQSRPEDITMREEYGEPNLGRPDDDFGDSTFEDAGDRDFVGEPINIDSMEDNNEADMTLTNELVKNQSSHVFPEMPSSVGMGNNDSDFADVMDVDYGDTESVDNLETMFQDTVNPVSESISGVESRLIDSTLESTINSTLTNNVDNNATVDSAPLPIVVEEESSILIDQPITSESVELVSTVQSGQLPQFVLPPINKTMRENRRAPKRKRKLLIDEHKSIPSDVMKLQMQDTTEITTRLDLAPPTRKLMLWKETGNVEALFTTPGRAIPSRILQKLFYRNMKTVAVANDAVDGLPVIPGFKRVGGFLNLDEESFSTTTSLSETNMLPVSIPAVVPEPNQAVEHVGGIQQSHLCNISEVTESEVQEHHLPDGACSSYSTNYDCWSGGHPTPHRDEDEPIELNESVSGVPIQTNDQQQIELSSPMLTGTRIINHPPSSTTAATTAAFGDVDETMFRPPLFSLGHSMEVGDDIEKARDFSNFSGTGLDFMSVNSMSVDRSMRSDELSDTQTKLQATISMLDQQFEEVNEEYPLEITQEGLEKRSEIMLNGLKIAMKRTGQVDFNDMTVSNNKKQAASKFYTLLLLGKQKKLKMHQDDPQSNIIITYVDTD